MFLTFKFLWNQFSLKQGFYVLFTKILPPLMGSSIRFLTTPIQEKLGKDYMQPKPHPDALWLLKLPINRYIYKYSILHMHQAVILLEISAYFPPMWMWTLHLWFYISWSHVSTQGVPPAMLTQWKIIVPVTEPLFWKFSTQPSSSYPSLLRPRNYVEKKKGHLTVDKKPLFQPAVFSLNQIL